MTLAAKLLEQNPEVYTVWNYRREALQDTLQVSAHHNSTNASCRTQQQPIYHIKADILKELAWGCRESTGLTQLTRQSRQSCS